MLIGMVTDSGIVGLVKRPEESVAEWVELYPTKNYFFLSTDISTVEHDRTKSTADYGPHLLTDCWCGGS